MKNKLKLSGVQSSKKGLHFSPQISVIPRVSRFRTFRVSFSWNRLTSTTLCCIDYQIRICWQIKVWLRNGCALVCSLCNMISMDFISKEINRRGLSSHKTREENPGYKVKFLFTIQTTFVTYTVGGSKSTTTGIFNLPQQRRQLGICHSSESSF